MSSQGVYVGESKSDMLRLRPATKAALMVVRGLGAMVAKAKLAEMTPAKKAKAGKRGRGKGRK